MRQVTERLPAAGLKSGDPNLSAAKARAFPDFRVYDRHLNSIYEVEVKTTRQPPSRWQARKDNLDIQCRLHPDVVLTTYVGQDGRFAAQYARLLNWSAFPVLPDGPYAFYQIYLDSYFTDPVEIFPGIDRDRYVQFLSDASEVLESFPGRGP